MKSMRTNMLEYSKTILAKVSFSRKLFIKELWKTNRLLSLRERFRLLHWLKKNFAASMPTLVALYEKSVRNKVRPFAFAKS